eukprot:6651158-Prymnesium_polylepis.1
MEAAKQRSSRRVLRGGQGNGPHCAGADACSNLSSHELCVLPDGMEAAIRISYKGGSLLKQDQSDETTRNVQAGALMFGDKQIAQVDGKGKITLQPELVDRWFSTADDPFQGKCKVPVTLQGKPEHMQLAYDTLWLPPAGLRVRLASSKVSSPLGGTIVEVKVGSVVVCVDNSGELKELWPMAASTHDANPFEGPGPWTLLCAFLREKQKEDFTERPTEGDS